jgi:transforming growth factor-beta-induced protein
VRHRLLLAVALLGALVLGAAPAASANGHPGPCPKNIVQVAAGAGDFTTLVRFVQQAGLADTLAHGGPFTVFAPTDEAFAKVPKATLDALAADPALLKQVLLYHVVSGRVSSGDAVRLPSATTLEGEDVTFTVPAGGGLQVNDSTVVAADVPARNGVIHAIDTVLMPPSLAPAPALPDIVATAVAAGQFTTLVKLLQATGLDAALQGPGPFTVFAPTDAAFAKVPRATLDALAADPVLLKQVLSYHVVSGRISAAEAAKARMATTLEGAPVYFRSRCDGPFWWWARRWHRQPAWCDVLRVNNATIVQPDIATSNGVIHAIDTVLLPPAH